MHLIVKKLLLLMLLLPFYSYTFDKAAIDTLEDEKFDFAELTEQAHDTIIHITSFLSIHDKAFQELIRHFSLNSRSAHDLAEHFIDIFTHFPETKSEIDIIVNKHFNITSKKSNLKATMKKVFLSMLNTYKVDIALQQADFKVLKDNIHSQEIEELSALTKNILRRKSLEELIDIGNKYVMYLTINSMINRHTNYEKIHWKSKPALSFTQMLYKHPSYSIFFIDIPMYIMLSSLGIYLCLHIDARKNHNDISKALRIAISWIILSIVGKLTCSSFPEIRELLRTRYQYQEINRQARQENIDISLMVNLENQFEIIYDVLLYKLKEELTGITVPLNNSRYDSIKNKMQPLKFNLINYKRRFKKFEQISKIYEEQEKDLSLEKIAKLFDIVDLNLYRD